MRVACAVVAATVASALIMALVLACESHLPDVDGGSDLTCDALPSSCSVDDGSAVATFTAETCPDLAQVIGVACPDAETVFAVCGVGGVYVSFSCKRPSCVKGPCDGGRDAKAVDAAEDRDR
jgi:hypothetical protein